MKQEKQILLVEDDVSINHLTLRILERAGYAVVSYTEPVPALDYFLSNPEKISVVITDLSMIEMSGLELAQNIWKAHPETVVILASGYAGSEAKEKALEAGFFALLEKPFRSEDLTELLARAVQKSGTP